eukprot:255703_1
MYSIKHTHYNFFLFFLFLSLPRGLDSKSHLNPLFFFFLFFLFLDDESVSLLSPRTTPPTGFLFPSHILDPDPLSLLLLRPLLFHFLPRDFFFDHCFYLY